MRKGKATGNKKPILIGGIVVAVAIVAALAATMLVNHPPAIASLEAPKRVLPNQRCQIVCNARDRDGDELSYNWTCSGGNISGTGAAVNWTAPNSIGSYNITCTVIDGRGGEATRQVTIQVRPNLVPTVSRLAVGADWTLPSGSLNVTCTASDPDEGDRDELSYEWTATGGSISGIGAAVKWTAPRERGVYYLTVVVRDGHGSSDTSMVPVSVVTSEPPAIKELRITADHCYLRTNTSPYKVGQGKDYHIQCIVADAGVGLSYEWSRTAGNVTGLGSTITWTAPKSTGKVTITAIVSDAAGNAGVKALLLDVVGCNPCTFPGCSG